MTDRWYNIEVNCRTGERKLVRMSRKEIAAAEAREAAAATLDVVKTECKRRLLETMSEAAQMNMAAAAVAGVMSTEEKAAYVEALGWIGKMRAACAGAVGKADFLHDKYWPAVPASVFALVSKY